MDNTPRELLRRLMAENPDADKARLRALMWEKITDDPDLPPLVCAIVDEVLDEWLGELTNGKPN